MVQAHKWERWGLVWLTLLGLLTACEHERSAEHFRTRAGTTQVARLSVHTNNNASYSKRLELIESAQKQIDLAYYIYDRDFSSSYLTERLLEKAKQGIPVRILTDWISTSSYPEFFKMLVAKGGGNLQVAYFRPPSPVLISDLQNLGVGDPLAFLSALVNLDFKRALQEWLKPVKTEALLRRRTPVGLATRVKDLQGLLPYLRRWEDSTAPTVESFTEQKYAALETGEDNSRKLIHLPAWFDFTKRLHHKILIVDGIHVMGGGRNIQDSYHWEEDHPIRLKHAANLDFHYIFMDTDFALESPELAEEALVGFEQYWDCATNGPMCLVPWGAALEKADLSEGEVAKHYADFKNKAAEFAPYAHTIPGNPVQGVTFEEENVATEYFENTMHPWLATKGRYLYEYPSAFNRRWVQSIDDTKSGETILIQNAYFFLPGKIILAVIRAVKRGVKFEIHTNSSESSDLGFVSKLARFQYRELLRLGDRHNGAIQLYEYHTPESLHSKVNIFGDHSLTVSSVNADPRSEYLDTNNGVWIENASLAVQYRDWFRELRKRLLASGEMEPITRGWLDQREESELITTADEQKTEWIVANRIIKTIVERAYWDPNTCTEAQRTLSERARHFIDMLFIQI